MSPRILHPPVSDLSSALARTASLPSARVSAVGVGQADQGAFVAESNPRSAAPFKASPSGQVPRLLGAPAEAVDSSSAATSKPAVAAVTFSHDVASDVEAIQAPATVPHLRVLGGAVAKSSVEGIASGSGMAAGRAPKSRELATVAPSAVVITVLDVQLALARNQVPDDPSFADYLRAKVRALKAGEQGKDRAYGLLVMRQVDRHLAKFREQAEQTEARL